MDYTPEQLEEMAANTTAPWIEQLRAMSEETARLALINEALKSRTIIETFTDEDEGTHSHVLSPLHISLMQPVFDLHKAAGLEPQNGGHSKCRECGSRTGASLDYALPGEVFGHFYELCLSCWNVWETVIERFAEPKPIEDIPDPIPTRDEKYEAYKAKSAADFEVFKTTPRGQFTTMFVGLYNTLCDLDSSPALLSPDEMADMIRRISLACDQSKELALAVVYAKAADEVISEEIHR